MPLDMKEGIFRASVRILGQYTMTYDARTVVSQFSSLWRPRYICSRASRQRARGAGGRYGVPRSMARARQQIHRTSGQGGRRRETTLWRISCPAKGGALVVEAQITFTPVQESLRLLPSFLDRKIQLFRG